MNAGLPDEAKRLFTVPLAEFTERRNRLARELKAGGDEDAAAAVKALRKPRASAWAVNQLAREHSNGISELVALTERLRSIDSAEEFRGLGAERQDLVERLAEATPAVMEKAGVKPTASALHEVTQTLRAATSPEQLERLREGTLVEPYESSGFGAVPPFEGSKDAPAPSRDPELEELEGRLEQARVDVDDKRKAAEEARRDADEAEHRLELAQRAMARIQDRIDRKQRTKSRR